MMISPKKEWGNERVTILFTRGNDLEKTHPLTVYVLTNYKKQSNGQ